jgi:hypothetical protein
MDSTLLVLRVGKEKEKGEVVLWLDEAESE